MERISTSGQAESGVRAANKGRRSSAGSFRRLQIKFAKIRDI